MPNPLDLAGRSILVTGASSGIGRETAILLSGLNARIVLAGRDQTRLEETKSKLEGGGHRIEAFDLTQLDAIPKWVKGIADFGGPFAGLAHCAGVHAALPAPMLKPEKVESVMRANLSCSMLLAAAFRQKGCCLPGGSMVFVSSVAALAGAAGLSLYGASKAALIGMTKSMASEFAADRIRVNCVVAGLVQTEMTERLRARLTKEQFEGVAAMHPLGLGTARDVANAIAFLLADTGAWITGSALVVDGGYTAH